jgi:hypothetical protein
MIQSIFETNRSYRDSVFYDASAWSLANAYNLPYQNTAKKLSLKKEVFLEDFNRDISVEKADYAYIFPWTDYNSPALLYALQKEGIQLKTITKELNVNTKESIKNFSQGSIILSVNLQDFSKEQVYKIISEKAKLFNVPVTAVNAGNNGVGINIGGRTLRTLRKPKVLLWVGDGVSSYEAGEVWFLTDTHLKMPISKVKLFNFNKVNLNDYNTMIMVSGSYNQLDLSKIEKIKNWVSQGNTLITTRHASAWVIKNGLVNEELLTIKKDTSSKRLHYVDHWDNGGKERIGGAIFKINLDITHPIGYGYTTTELPIYKNNKVFLKPSKSAYSTVAQYTNNPHIDGYISETNYEMLDKSASIIVSPIGKGRVVLFADNPIFRGTWYGTNKLFFNALFFGNQIKVPR